MIDKLTMTSSEVVDPELASRQIKDHYKRVITTRTLYHNRVLVFFRPMQQNREGEHLLSLHVDPSLPSYGQTKIELNPSRFSCFGELRELVSHIFCDENELRISRLDHAVDVELPVERIHQSLVYPRKKSREVYKDGRKLTGCYIGAYPEKLSIYDKALESGLDGVLTRIELRQHNAKVMVKSFQKLPELVSAMPFESLKFFVPKTDPGEENQEQLEKLSSLQELFRSKGAQGAYKILNKHSNFKRNFKDCFEADPGIPNLNQLYNQNMLRFFKEELVYDIREANAG